MFFIGILCSAVVHSRGRRIMTYRLIYLAMKKYGRKAQEQKHLIILDNGSQLLTSAEKSVCIGHEGAKTVVRIPDNNHPRYLSIVSVNHKIDHFRSFLK
jgi:hypothetical protein